MDSSFCKGVQGRAGARGFDLTAGVEGGDEVAEGVQGVVVLIDGRFREGLTRIVMVEAGFEEQAGAFALDNAQAAGLDAGGDGGDAGADGVDPVDNLEVGMSQLGALVGAGRVAIPEDCFGKDLGVVAQRLAATKVLGLEPQDVLVVEDAPDGGQGTVVAEVDAADGEDKKGGRQKGTRRCVPFFVFVFRFQ